MTDPNPTAVKIAVLEERMRHLAASMTALDSEKRAFLDRMADDLQRVRLGLESTSNELKKAEEQIDAIVTKLTQIENGSQVKVALIAAVGSLLTALATALGVLFGG